MMNKHRIKILLVLPACLLVLAGCKPRMPFASLAALQPTATPTIVPCQPGPLEFEMLGYPALSGEYIIESQAAYDDFVANDFFLISSGGEWGPVIDFDKQMLVGVSYGLLSTGGYHLEITGIQNTCHEIIIQVLTYSPCLMELVTHSFTSPNYFTVIDRTDLPVVFEYYTDKVCPELPIVSFP